MYQIALRTFALMALMTAGKVFAAGLCDSSEIVACSNDLEDPKCLELYHACGRYTDIIASFKLDQLKEPTPMFFTGISFYGLFNQTRVKSSQCEYASNAKTLLTDYALTVKSNGNLRDGDSFRRVYIATNILNALKDNKGCLEDGLTTQDAESIGTTFGDELLSKVFIGVPDTTTALGSAISTIKKSVNDTIAAISSSAAEIENQLNMRRQALKSSSDLLKTLSARFKKFFGDSEYDLNERDIVTDTTFEYNDDHPTIKNAKLNGPMLLTIAEDNERAVMEALGQTSADDYQNAKTSLITQAKDEVSLSTATTSHSLKLIDPITQGKDLAPLLAKMKAAANGNASAETLKKLQTKWNQYNEAGCGQNSLSWTCATQGAAQ